MANAPSIPPFGAELSLSKLHKLRLSHLASALITGHFVSAWQWSRAGPKLGEDSKGLLELHRPKRAACRVIKVTVEKMERREGKRDKWRVVGVAEEVCERQCEIQPIITSALTLSPSRTFSSLAHLRAALNLVELHAAKPGRTLAFTPTVEELTATTRHVIITCSEASQGCTFRVELERAVDLEQWQPRRISNSHICKAEPSKSVKKALLSVPMVLFVDCEPVIAPPAPAPVKPTPKVREVIVIEETPPPEALLSPTLVLEALTKPRRTRQPNQLELDLSPTRAPAPAPAPREPSLRPFASGSNVLVEYIPAYILRETKDAGKFAEPVTRPALLSHPFAAPAPVPAPQVLSSAATELPALAPCSPLRTCAGVLPRAAVRAREASVIVVEQQIASAQPQPPATVAKASTSPQKRTIDLITPSPSPHATTSKSNTSSKAPPLPQSGLGEHAAPSPKKLKPSPETPATKRESTQQLPTPKRSPAELGRSTTPVNTPPPEHSPPLPLPKSASAQPSPKAKPASSTLKTHDPSAAPSNAIPGRTRLPAPSPVQPPPPTPEKNIAELPPLPAPSTARHQRASSIASLDSLYQPSPSPAPTGRRTLTEIDEASDDEDDMMLDVVVEEDEEMDELESEVEIAPPKSSRRVQRYTEQELVSRLSSRMLRSGKQSGDKRSGSMKP